MSFNRTQIWQHIPSGELYLVAVNDDDEVRDSCGPVTQREAEYTHDEGAGFFNGDAETTEWIIANLDSFKVQFAG